MLLNKNLSIIGVAAAVTILFGYIIYISFFNKEDFGIVAPLQLETPQPCPTLSDQNHGLMSVPSDDFTIEQQQINPTDLLPTGKVVEEWVNQFPQGQGDLAGKNFLTPSQTIGIDTVGTRRKNMTLDIRGEPLIPKKEISPWGNSSIMPQDLINRKKYGIIMDEC